MTRPPARCNACQVKRVAWVKPRVDYCYECLPGGPFTPPACHTCGSQDYFSEGLCEKCHPGGPLLLGSCRGCLAWGVHRAYGWLCWSCRWWRTHYPIGDCQHCARHARIGERGACRLCMEQARLLQQPGRALDLPGATKYGQQLFFANMQFHRPRFINPTRGMSITPVHKTVPLPLDTEAVRQALDSPDPAVALAVALVAFHALTSRQLFGLKLTDIVDGRLTLKERRIPLAGPVRVRLAAWLDYRARTWPGSINPHLFVGRRSAPRLVPVGRQFPWTKTNLRPQALREDRILQEIHATGGDIRSICDLFGIGIGAALRYHATVEHPDLTETRDWVQRT